MTHHHIAVSSTTPSRMAEAKHLAEALALPLLPYTESETCDFLLVYTPDYLGIYETGKKLSSPFYINFLAPKLLYRQQHASLRKELLARAMGLSPHKQPTIIDATAGLGRDSFILASLGFHITLLERSPIMHALLKDAITRASQHPSLTPVMNRMHLILADAMEFLPTQPPVDIIYLDPMFPERKKSASVKKEMAILQDLLGTEKDTDPLLRTALTCATHRVVVKRPRFADRISDQEPNFILAGKSSRFDIYLPKR